LQREKKQIRGATRRIRGTAGIIVIGDSVVAAAAFAAIERQGDDVEWLRTPVTAASKGRAFLARDRERVVFRAASAQKAGARAASSLDVSALARRLRGRTLVVCALGNTRFRAILDVCDAARQAQVPIIFAACDAHALSV